MKTALIAGATGLIGAALLTRLTNANRYNEIIVVGRRAPDVKHPRIRFVSTDFGDLEEKLAPYSPDDVFCCLGTTMAKAGTRDKFYEVDFHYPVRLARASLARGARQYLIVTALGADSKSSIYYNRVKGEVEEAIRNSGFPTVHIFRPSLLLGPRKEKRAGEDAAKAIYRIFNFLIPPKYKGIEGARVADAMLTAASREDAGVFIHSSGEMQRSDYSQVQQI